MDLKEGLLAIRNMCENRRGCNDCKLNQQICFGVYCKIPEEWTDDSIDELVQTAEKWKKKNFKTLQEVLIERFPHAPMWKDENIPKKCPDIYFGEDFMGLCTGITGNTNPCNMCRDCWDRIAPSKYQGK